jgi:predicted DNA-binding mobile mystery protein A
MIEKAEATGSITLESLERAAQALDCRLVYAFVPRKPLDTLVKERARLLAQKRLESASHTMALEAQGVETSDENEQLKRLVQQFIAKSSSKLWEDTD